MHTAGTIRNIFYGVCVCTGDNPLAKVRGLFFPYRRENLYVLTCVTVLCQVRHCVKIKQLSYCLSYDI